jgi:hypothetical protein
VVRRVRLGDWTCPSGNNVEVFYRPFDDNLAVFEMAWDTPPPLSVVDEHYYITTILPAVDARVREYTEKVGGPTLVILA